MYKDSPARRQIYEEVTDAAAFPISFCKTRWCESEICAKRAAEIWDRLHEVYSTFNKFE